MQNKDSADKTLVSWHGEDACPVNAVKYQASYASDISIYVQLRNYVGLTNVQLETTGKSRFEGGQCAYFDFSGAALTDAEIAAIDGLKDARAKFSISAGDTGLGFDGGCMMLKTALENGKLVVYINGTKYLLALEKSPM